MKTVSRLAVLAMVAAASAAQAAVITFDDGAVSEGSTLADQYQVSHGVSFFAGLGGATGVNPTSLGGGGFATNSDLTIVSSSGSDVGGGVSSPISGLLLHSFNGWLGEDNDAVLYMTFASPISAISIDFGGVFDSDSTRIFAIDANNAAIASVSAATTGTTTLTLSPSQAVSKVVVTYGDFYDWVGLDNINFTTAAVPEPTSSGLMVLGGLAAASRRRRA
jgi:hypothetical protein